MRPAQDEEVPEDNEFVAMLEIYLAPVVVPFFHLMQNVLTQERLGNIVTGTVLLGASLLSNGSEDALTRNPWVRRR